MDEPWIAALLILDGHAVRDVNTIGLASIQITLLTWETLLPLDGFHDWQLHVVKGVQPARSFLREVRLLDRKPLELPLHYESVIRGLANTWWPWIEMASCGLSTLCSILVKAVMVMTLKNGAWITDCSCDEECLGCTKPTMVENARWKVRTCEALTQLD